MNVLVVLETHFEVVEFVDVSREKDVWGNWRWCSLAEVALGNSPGDQWSERGLFVVNTGGEENLLSISALENSLAS